MKTRQLIRRAVLSLAVASPVAAVLAVAPTRVAAATVSVTNCNDSGVGSLREAVATAGSGATISFALAPACNLITLTSAPIDLTTNLTIAGPGAGTLAVSGDNARTVFVVTSSLTSTTVISGLTIENGMTTALGAGGIYNEGRLTLTNSTVSHNQARKIGGGGILNDGTMTVTDSTVSGNHVTKGYGGGISNDGTLTVTDSTVRNNSAREGGGGIFNSYIGPLDITDSTVSNNSVKKGAGGGIYNDNGALSVTSSTLSDNAADDSEVGWGGGIYNIEDASGSVTVIHSTLSGNSAADGGGIFEDDATIDLAATIVANSGTGRDCSGNATSDGGYNLDDDGSCGFSGTSLSDTPAGLDPTGLAHNGGLTRTIALEPGGAAVGAVANTSLCGGQDQRGVPRPSLRCDIGAYQSALAIRPFKLAKATVHKAYAATLTAAGGEQPYTWKLSAGRLPARMSLSPSGEISGRPRSAGRYSFTVEVSDASTPALTATKTYSMRVAMSISPSKLPMATVNTTYSATLSAAGGTRPYRWTLSAGRLPARLSLSSSGRISGTPKTAGTYSFSVQVSDASSPAHSATRGYSFTVR